MAHFKNFEELEIFKIARDLSQKIWHIIQFTSLSRDFELKNQINASSGSVMDNIAEGFGRGGNREFINFLGIAKGSCCETRSQLIRCHDRGHISNLEFQKLDVQTQALIEQLSKFSNYLKNSDKKGSKFD